MGEMTKNTESIGGKGGVLGAKKFKLEKKDNKKLRDPMFVGVDPSYNGFAIMVLDEKGDIVEQRLLSSSTDKEIEERILELKEGFKFIAEMIRLHSICIEGPSFSSNGKFVLQMGALHYYLRLFLYEKGIEYKIVTPNELKKFVCGNGRAKKDLMLMKTFKKWGIEFEDDNLCDAYGLAQIALEEFKNGQIK
jgi:crossover junction endodeoxyribonuclease RuvC